MAERDDQNNENREEEKGQERRSLADSIIEDEGIEERLQEEEENKDELPSVIADNVRNRYHSIGSHPALPEDQETTFEERKLTERYREVCDNYRQHHDVDNINDDEVMEKMAMDVMTASQIEKPYRERLQDIAVDLVRREYDVPLDDIEIRAELKTVEEMTEDVDIGGGDDEEEMSMEELNPESEEERNRINQEVYKRRMINCLIQGAAVKGLHMFHMGNENIREINPQLPTKYSRLVAASDYQYMSPNPMMLEAGVFTPPLTGEEEEEQEEQNEQGGEGPEGQMRLYKAGDVEVEFPQNEGDKPVIHAKGVTLPVLIHEIVKGVMEILSAHGLPEDDDIRKFVINHADRIHYEIWDLILGPTIWEEIIQTMEPDDFLELKQHIYSDLISLPPQEFHDKLKEILGNTQKGKQIIDEMSSEIRRQIQHEDYERSIERYSDDAGGTDDPGDLGDLL